ncbi:hypothetical protein Lalb_Chr19g0135131 [Lupinus albus]|uniref:Uncharacterized protein n=1 Tax=Lupinus albus TaxID=3870 RepID=A0A6A4NVB3_LUPAL|nr:hypothetical protein Lalb_Chr19g0135131 [Lupinus albus]
MFSLPFPNIVAEIGITSGFCHQFSKLYFLFLASHFALDHVCAAKSALLYCFIILWSYLFRFFPYIKRVIWSSLSSFHDRVL